MFISYQKLISKTVAGIDQVTEYTGRCISWLSLLLMIFVFLIVLLRYGFNVGSIALQDSTIYLHSLIFLGASAYTLKHNGHVRVDVFYRQMTARQKAMVDCLGSLLLLIPVCLFIAYSCWNYIAQSWVILETSQDPGGLPFVYLLKSFLLILVTTLLLQGIAEFLRALQILMDSRETDNG